MSTNSNQSVSSQASSAESSDEVSGSIYDVFRQQHRPDQKPINLTVGNPNLPPPSLYYDVLYEVLTEITAQQWNGHGYAVEPDPFGLCVKIADHLNERFDIGFLSKDVAITVGATGALDVICKTLLDAVVPNTANQLQNEVIVLAPYFVEYINIVEANGGIPVVVHTNDQFGLDLDAIEAAIGPQTKILLINSPNNPTGAIYGESSLQQLGELLRRKEIEYGKPVFVIEDAVYDTIHFDDQAVPSLVPYYPHLFRVNSWSKSISLSGERIGYLAMHPQLAADQERNQLRTALFLNIRMRVVHAPLLQHRVLARLPVNCVTDIGYYRRNIETLYQCLSQLGFGVMQPRGTFYLWAVLPGQFSDEVQFRKKALAGDEPLLYLPGFLFGGNKYKRCVRFSACVAFEEILRACVKLRQLVPDCPSELDFIPQASSLCASK